MAWWKMCVPKNQGGMGFRDIHYFNLALLARQAWRTLTDDTSLSARILKAVYFPECSLLQAELGAHPSQIWRAILEGRDILAQGMVRRIGDGASTDIWQHNWIPRDSFKRPITSLTPNPPVRVAQLIDTTSACWNKGLVRTVFTHFDAEVILKIPMCTRRVEDFWAWHHDPRGRFSVRSAYHMILKTKHSREAGLNEEGGTSYEFNESNIWSTIWHIQVPSKLKMFVWRLA